MTFLKRARRKVTRSDAFVAALAAVTRAFIVTYARTLRVTVDSSPEHDALDTSRVLYGFWHGRQFLLVPAFRDTGTAIMTQLSWAGDIQTRVLERLGYVVVRGSSRRSPARALAAMKAAVEGGRPAAFALDGPRGPVRKSKPGILFLARRLGCPVVPVGTSASRSWRIPGTWCRYLLPLPFATCVVTLGRPIRVDEATNTEDLNREVDRVTREADLAVGAASGRLPGADTASAEDGGVKGGDCVGGGDGVNEGDGANEGDGDKRGEYVGGGDCVKEGDRVRKPDEEWKKVLTPHQFHVTREKGTEPPFTGEYNDFKGEGIYNCVCCGNPLFRSTEKYDSGSGWPSFWAPISEDSVRTEEDDFGGMPRTEVKCGRCGAHLGHVFDDGPQPTGLRYCTNSASLDFDEAKDEGSEG